MCLSVFILREVESLQILSIVFNMSTSFFYPIYSYP